MDKKYIIGFIAGILVLLGLLIYINNKSNGPVSTINLDAFAMCLKEEGAIFYGAYWCPHCQATKKLFGDSKTLLPYVECSTPDGAGQLQVCKDKAITSYPTWIFADNSRLTGEQTLQTLSAKTNCPLPAELAGAIASTTVTTASSSSAIQ